MSADTGDQDGSIIAEKEKIFRAQTDTDRI